MYEGTRILHTCFFRTETIVLLGLGGEGELTTQITTSGPGFHSQHCIWTLGPKTC